MKFNKHTLIGTMRTIKVRRCPEYTQNKRIRDEAACLLAAEAMIRLQKRNKT